jgi:hypothetical protein
VIIVLAIVILLSAYVVFYQLRQADFPSVSTVENERLSLSGWPSQIAVDTNSSKIYVTDLLSTKLAVINESNYALINTVTLPVANGSVGDTVVNSQTNIVYISVSQNPDGIIELNGRTDQIVGGIAVSGIGSIAIDENTNVLWATSQRNYVNASGIETRENSLYAINAGTGKLVANISLSAYPLDVSVDPNNNMIFMSACATLSLACQGAQVVIVNGASYSVKSTVSLQNFNALNFPVVVNPVADMAYVIGEASSMQFVSINGETGAIQQISTLGSSCAGAGGGMLAINTDNNEVYALFASQTYFLAIDGSSGRIANMLNLTGFPYYPQDVAYDSKMNQIYITAFNNDNHTGYLWAVPSNFGDHTYVNLNLLPSGGCVP